MQAAGPRARILNMARVENNAGMPATCKCDVCGEEKL